MAHEQSDFQSPGQKNYVSPEEREFVDPEERIRPMPIAAAIVAIGMFIWGVIYILTVPQPLTPSQYGDERTLADLKAKPAGAGGGAVDGKALFAANCAACHQATGSGVPGVFPPLAKSEWVNADGRMIASILLHGISGELQVEGATYNGQMPSFAHLSDADIAGVASYVRGAFGNTGKPIDAKLVAEQRKATADQAAPWAGTKGLKELESKLPAQAS